MIAYLCRFHGFVLFEFPLSAFCSFPAFVGSEHWEVAQGVLKVLDGIEDSGSRSARARRIRNFLSQPFFVAEAYTNRPGAYVPRQETIAAFAALLAGRYDHLPEEAFLMRGGLPAP